MIFFSEVIAILIKSTHNVREIEKTDYDLTNKDYSESVDALQRAIAVLKKQSHDRGQKASLAQVSALKNMNLIPDTAKKATRWSSNRYEFLYGFHVDFPNNYITAPLRGQE